MKKILIISSKFDEHSDYIIKKLNLFGYSDFVVRLNTEDFATNTYVNFDGENLQVNILDSNKAINTNDIGVVWYRRPLPIVSKIHEDDGVNHFIKSQFQVVLDAIYALTKNHALWINKIESNICAKNKIYQLKLAKHCGLKVPKNMVTNNLNKLPDLGEKICNKSLDKPRYSYNGVQYPYMTKIVDKSFLMENIDSLKLCPTLLEEYIDKDSDLRVVVFGNHIFPFEIFSQDNELSKVDYRGFSPDKLRHEYVNLPDELYQKILLFMKKQDLYFSSIDFVKKDDDYYFIENNCNGQWLWLENVTGVNMSDVFINEMISLIT